MENGNRKGEVEWNLSATVRMCVYTAGENI